MSFLVATMSLPAVDRPNAKESSKVVSGGNSHGLKIKFLKIPAMVDNFFSLQVKQFLTSKVGDKNPLR